MLTNVGSSREPDENEDETMADDTDNSDARGVTNSSEQAADNLKQIVCKGNELSLKSGKIDNPELLETDGDNDSSELAHVRSMQNVCNTGGLSKENRKTVNTYERSAYGDTRGSFIADDNLRTGSCPAPEAEISKASDKGIADRLEPLNEGLNNLEITSGANNIVTEMFNINEPEVNLNVTRFPANLLDISLKCLSCSTVEKLTLYLDCVDTVSTFPDRPNDWNGLAELLPLDRVFVRYISQPSFCKKTSAIINEWMKSDQEPLPTMGNLLKCLQTISRPDVLEDLKADFVRDAENWRKSGPGPELWMLTRHDLTSQQSTKYVCCIVYADGDRNIVLKIQQLYNIIRPGDLFFIPQTDLLTSTKGTEFIMKVIEERCGNKSLFILSKNFTQSESCNAVAQVLKGTASALTQDNVIPFWLTEKTNDLPRILQCLAGIKWYNRLTRRKCWELLTEYLFGGKISCDELEQTKQKLGEVINSNPSYYLSDELQSDRHTAQSSAHDHVQDSNSTPNFINPDNPVVSPHKDSEVSISPVTPSVQEPDRHSGSRLLRIRHFVRKKIFRRLNGQNRNINSSVGHK